MRSIFKVLFIIHRIVWTVKRHAKYDEYLSTIWILSKSQCAFKSITWLKEFGNIRDTVNETIFPYDDRKIITLKTTQKITSMERMLFKMNSRQHEQMIQDLLINELLQYIKASHNLIEIHEYDQLHLGYMEYRATINIVEARK